MKLLTIVHELSYFDDISKTIQEKFVDYERVNSSLEYVLRLVELVKSNKNKDRDISFDRDFLSDTFEKCLNSEGESVLFHLLDLARYFVGVIKEATQIIETTNIEIDSDKSTEDLSEDEHLSNSLPPVEETEEFTEPELTELEPPPIIKANNSIETLLMSAEKSKPMVVLVPINRALLTKIDPLIENESNPGGTTAASTSGFGKEDSKAMDEDEGENSEGDGLEDDERDNVSLTEDDKKVLLKMQKYDEFLEKLKCKIEELESIELTFTELEEGTYILKTSILKDRLKKTEAKLRKLCKENEHLIDGEIPKRPANQFSKPITVKISKYPEVNAKLTSQLSRYKEFPEFADITDWVTQVNVELELGMSKELVEEESRIAFKEIGRILKLRRKNETESIFNTYMNQEAAIEYEELSKDKDIAMKQEQNKKAAQEQQAALICKISSKSEQDANNTNASKSDHEDSEDDEDGSPEKSNEDDTEIKSNLDASSDNDDASFDDGSDEEKKSTIKETTSSHKESVTIVSNEITNLPKETVITPVKSPEIPETIVLISSEATTSQYKPNAGKRVVSEENSEERVLTVFKKAKIESSQPWSSATSNNLGISILSAGSDLSFTASGAIQEEDDCICLD